MLTEDQRNELVNKCIDDLTLDLTDILDITNSTKHIRSGMRTPLKPPMVVYSFMPIEGEFFKPMNLALGNITSKYPTFGFAQPEFVEIRTYAEDDEDLGVSGLDIAYLMIEKIRQFIFYYWREMLPAYGAFIKFGSLRIVDESAFIQGTNLFSFVMRFVMITTTQWQFTPYRGAEDELVESVVTDLDDEALENSIQIKVEV